jgi:nucleotide-binding universal stress UspA family protein
LGLAALACQHFSFLSALSLADKLATEGSQRADWLKCLKIGATGSTTGRMVSGLVEERKVEVNYFPARILLATDASKDAEKAALIASDIANSTGSELHVLHVGNTKDFHVAPSAEQSFSPRTAPLGEVREKAEKTLEEAVKQVEEVGGTVTQATLRMGDPDDEILRFCDEQGEFGLIVMGSRGLTRIKRVVMGSVSESIVRHAHCPVLVARS